MEGGGTTSFREVKRRANCLALRKYDEEAYIRIPLAYRKYFKNRVKLLFDPEKNLIALQPSEDETDYPTSHWRVWCTEFVRRYNIPPQEVPAVWDSKNNYLIAKIRRN